MLSSLRISYSDCRRDGGSPRDASAALTADFAQRDQLPESPVPESAWYKPGSQESWGPKAAHYPPVRVPAGADPVEWKRARILAVAKHYLGLPYQHHHIPAWAPRGTRGADRRARLLEFHLVVYNYGLALSSPRTCTCRRTGRTRRAAARGQ